jgi:hypothetical protein
MFQEYAAGDWRCLSYTKANGQAVAGGSGDVATDTIWDAAGDLVYGTGADTGARLAPGTGLQQLRMNSGATAPEWFTPVKFKRSVYTYNMVAATAASTWNSTTVGPAGAASLYQRHRLMSFDDGQGAGTAEGAYMNFQLPQDYVAGTDIKIIANIITNTTGDAIFYFGVAQPTAGNDLGNTTETEWVTQTAAGVVGYRIIPLTFTFDGTNMSPGDSLSIMVYRDADAVGDTLTGDCWLHTFDILEA